MEKKYWHEISAEEESEVYSSGITYDELLKKYKQPDWCNYPNALLGSWGCWSLTGSHRADISPEFCKNCECNVNYVKPPSDNPADYSPKELGIEFPTDA